MSKKMGSGGLEEAKRALKEAKEAKEAAARQAAEAKAQSAEMKSLRNEVSQMKTKMRNNNPETSGGAGTSRFNKDPKACWICGKTGHLSNDCPDKDKDKDAEE